MAKKTVANLLVDTLVAAGVKRVYGLAGDSLYMLKALLSGHGDDIIDLAEINLFR